MAIIQRFNVVKMALFLGLFGFFLGIIGDIIFSIMFLASSTMLSLFSISFGITLLIFPIAYSVVCFILGLIFTLLANLTLKIIKGIELDMDLTETPAPIKTPSFKEKTVKTKTPKISQTTPVLKTNKTETGNAEKKVVASHPRKSTLDSTPISQMTNAKTASRNTSPKTSTNQ